MHRIFILSDKTVVNVDNDADAERLLASEATEVPQEDAVAVFGEDLSIVSSGCVTVAEDGTLTFAPPDRSAEGLTWNADTKAWDVDLSFLNQERRTAILAELADLDADSLRPLRAVAAGTGTAEDSDKLAALEQQAAILRAELAELK